MIVMLAFTQWQSKLVLGELKDTESLPKCMVMMEGVRRAQGSQRYRCW